MQSSYATNDNHRGLGQRLRLEMKKRGMSSVELARRADVKTSFLYDVISGKSANPSSIKLARVAESLGVSLTYLAGTSDSPRDDYQFLLSESVQNYCAVQYIYAENEILQSRELQGDPYNFHKDWFRNHLNISPADARLFTIQGDNMAPTLLHGDIVLVDTTQKQASPPGMFVLLEGTGLVVKRLEILAASSAALVRIKCDNPQYSTYESTTEAVKIIGRVVWFSRSI